MARVGEPISVQEQASHVTSVTTVEHSALPQLDPPSSTAKHSSVTARKRMNGTSDTIISTSLSEPASEPTLSG